VLSEELCILSSCFLSPMSKNSVLEELRVRRLAVKKQFDLSPQILVCCRSLTLLTLQSVKILKSKMAAAAIVNKKASFR